MAKPLSPTLRKAQANTRTQRVMRVSFEKAASSGCAQCVLFAFSCAASHNLTPSLQGRGSKYSKTQTQCSRARQLIFSFQSSMLRCPSTNLGSPNLAASSSGLTYPSNTRWLSLRTKTLNQKSRRRVRGILPNTIVLTPLRFLASRARSRMVQMVPRFA